MGRALKKGLDYVSLDVNFFHDIKIRKLIRYKGITAPMVYQVLLCEIYRQGYYLIWDDDLPFLISETSGAKEEEINEIITLCLKVGLFDSTLNNKYKILTSAEIQENYFYACQQTKRKIVYNQEYLLTNINMVKGITSKRKFSSHSSEEMQINSEEMQINSEEMQINSEEMQINSEEMQINSEEIFPSKRKTTKKETPLSPSPYTLKEKNNKKKKPTTTTTAHVREGENRDGEDEPSKEQSFSMSVAQGVEELLKDITWISHVEKLFKISSDGVKNWLQVFSTECSCRDNEAHENLTDIKRHFVDWLKKKDLTKVSALSEMSKINFFHSSVAPRPKTEVERKWDAMKQYLLDNVEESDQSLVVPLELVGFYPAGNKLVIQAPDNALVDRLEQKYMKVLKTAISYEFGKPYVEYNIKK